MDGRAGRGSRGYQHKRASRSTGVKYSFNDSGREKITLYHSIEVRKKESGLATLSRLTSKLSWNSIFSFRFFSGPLICI